MMETKVTVVIQLQLTRGKGHFEFSGHGTYIHIPELDLVMSFQLAGGTIHIKNLQSKGVFCGHYWPHDKENQSIFTLPMTE